MRKIIINADDLGKSPNVNAAIAEALTKKVITSSTILANTECWREVHNIVDNNPDASFGVHLNLTEGQSLTKNSVLEQYDITDAQGFFTGQIKKVKEINKVLKDAIYDELSAQVNKIKNEEHILISHIDGHHHVHTLETISSVIIKILRNYDINRMRNRYTWPIVFPHLGIKKRFKDLRWRMHFKNEDIVMTPYFCSYAKIIDNLKAGMVYPDNTVIELMCHPGHIKYIDETELINSKEVERYLNDVQYLNYRNL